MARCHVSEGLQILSCNALDGTSVDAATRKGCEIERKFANWAPRSVNHIARIRTTVRRLADRNLRAEGSGVVVFRGATRTSPGARTLSLSCGGSCQASSSRYHSGESCCRRCYTVWAVQERRMSRSNTRTASSPSTTRSWWISADQMPSGRTSHRVRRGRLER